MITKDLTITITNENEGLTCTIKTASLVGKDTVSIVSDPGIYNLEELIKALEIIKEFNK